MSLDPILCVSYFDQIIGPSTLYSSESLSGSIDAPDINRILEFNDVGEGTFIFTYRKYRKVNHIFYIASELARGGNEKMMITAIFKDEIVDVFKYLDSKEEFAEIISKTPILEDFAEELKRLNGLTSFLHLRKNFSFADEELKASFLEIFNRYLKKLTYFFNEKFSYFLKIKWDEKFKMSQDPILCVSYFDHRIGPYQLYCSKPLADVVGAPDLDRILEFNYKEGTFTFAHGKYQTVNHLFYIDSKFPRGGKDLLMITFMIKPAFYKFYKDEIDEAFKRLDSNMPILEDFAEDLKRLNGLTSFLHLRHYNFSFADEELKASFLEIFNRYLKKLTEKVLPLIKFEGPLVLVIAEPDILNLLKMDYEVKGYKVITSTDPKEALKIIEERYNEISMVVIHPNPTVKIDIFNMMPLRGEYPLLDEIKGNEKYKHIYIRAVCKYSKEPIDLDQFDDDSRYRNWSRYRVE